MTRPADEFLRELLGTVADAVMGDSLLPGSIAETVPRADARQPTADDLGRYAVIEPLGAGGMGEVLLVDDQVLGRQLAAKVIPTRILSARDLYVAHDSVIVPISASCKILDCVLVDFHTNGDE